MTELKKPAIKEYGLHWVETPPEFGERVLKLGEIVVARVRKSLIYRDVWSVRTLLPGFKPRTPDQPSEAEAKRLAEAFARRWIALAGVAILEGPANET